MLRLSSALVQITLDAPLSKLLAFSRSAQMRLGNLGAMVMLVAVLAGCGGGDDEVVAAAPSLGDPVGPGVPPPPQLSTFQSATTVIGQQNMTSSVVGTSDVLMSGIIGLAVAPDGRLFIVDRNNHRILSWNTVPTADGAPASFVLGQETMEVGDYQGILWTTFENPEAIAIGAGAMAVADTGHNRILIFPSIPDAPAQPGRVLGQGGPTTGNAGPCNASRLSTPTSVQITPGGRIVVADNEHGRILVWDALAGPDGADADHAIGQPNLTTCETAVSMSRFNAHQVWTDGQRMAVATGTQNRVLLWNSFPEGDVAADHVLGQPDGITAACNGPNGPALDTLCNATAVTSDGIRLAVWDAGNSRVLIWNSWPTSDKQPADVVLGQSDGMHTTANDDDQHGDVDATPQARTLSTGTALTFAGNRLLVADTGNNRVLVFNLQ
jgi:DNA-binding beta-propeller fold protein YncE